MIMKQKLSLLAFLWIGIAIYAQGQRSLLLVSGTEEPMQVFINNKPVNSKGVQELRILGLTDNYYNVKVKFLNRPHIVVAGKLYIPPQSEIVYEVYPPKRRSRRGDFVIADIYPLDNQLPYMQPQYVYHFGQAVNMEQGSSSVNQAGQININIQNNVSNNPAAPVVYVPGYNGPVGCTPPVTPDRFESMLHAVEKQTFEDSKLRVAKQIIKQNNCMTVNQLVQILRLFDFDQNKLKLAKYAYHYVYDIENYYKVNNVFDFDSNVQALDKYIQTQE